MLFTHVLGKLLEQLRHLLEGCNAQRVPSSPRPQLFDEVIELSERILSMQIY